MSKSFDVIVVGGGHAGCEAAAAAYRLGAATCLVTHRFATVGEMSCNPAIGGLGKGHLVREIDALDGLMGRVADAAGIQFRLLNRSKGPAVRGPRAQADRKLYRMAMQAEFRNMESLEVCEGAAFNLVADDGQIAGLVLEDGRILRSRSVVITTGTFLNGLIHFGEKKIHAGRVGEAPARGLSEQFKAFGLALGRLKTGTPARLDGKSIAWDSLEEQKGDDEPVPFSFMTERISNRQISCHITHTTAATHDIIARNILKSPLYSGQITGTGPRYCPSIEDKIHRFADKTSHQVFLEPEGLDDDTVYPNGISTSLPEDVQDSFIRSMPGLADVRILKPGYAIEYDYVDPRELTHALAVKKMPGLFLAGQINGTTGYEEAAGQGLVAGLNAARFAGGTAEAGFERSQSYIGVMIDDLVTRGVAEPYRMFTSRAEYRLSLRADNADRRLSPLGIALGLVRSDRSDMFVRKRDAIERGFALATELKMTTGELAKRGVKVNQDGQSRTALDLIGMAEAGFDIAARLWPDLDSLSQPVREALEAEALYAGYLDRQAAEIELLRKEEGLKIPASLDYAAMPSLSKELRHKLSRVQPTTLGQASRIDGMTPAGLAIILTAVKHPRTSQAA